MAKILVFSDFHLHNWSYGSTMEGPWNSRLLDQKKVGEKICELADQHRCDVVVFCGDLFHTHGRVEAGPLQVAGELFYNLNRFSSRRVYALVGNHDLGRESNSIEWMRGMGIRVVDDYLIDHEHGLGFAAFASDREQLVKRLDKLKEHKLQYWFLHQGVKSVPVGSDFVIPNEIFGPEDLPNDEVFEKAFTGHYHSHRNLDNIVVVGSPMQFTWSDKNEMRGCVMLDSWNNHFQFHAMNYPRFIELDEVMGLTSRKDLRHVFSVNGCFVRVIGDVPTAFMDDMRKKLMEGGARSVEFMVKKPFPTIGLADGSARNFNAEDLVKKYIDINKVPDEGVKIFEHIRANSYATNKD